MGQQVRRVYNGAGQWTHEGNIMIDKEGYRWDKKLVCFVALPPKSTAMVRAGRSVHLTTLFPWKA